MNDFNGEVQTNFTRWSLLSDGWHNASGSYRQGSESIPPKAWVYVCLFGTLSLAVLFTASALEFV
ncbi:hypothetical protein [Jezberella montanilacus]|uniref:hypothetical protein n=1 Tax=Jezberella montanilacus TaxID=323426 RepID=UPI000D076856|nr:hypothetical protein [Jezberella montanilacus]